LPLSPDIPLPSGEVHVKADPVVVELEKGETLDRQAKLADKEVG
jgi:hypothetical protein